jgi:hypothetical protein
MRNELGATAPIAGDVSRRGLVKAALAFGGMLAVPALAETSLRKVVKEPTPFAPLPPAPQRATLSPAAPSLPGVRPELLQRAKASLVSHGRRIARTDRMAIADFTASSSEPRFHLVDLHAGKVKSFLVAHGSGSDPAHTGFLQRFSNRPDSNASCEGAFVTSNYYYGKHGRSQRLLGLDPTNSNALERAIVVHGAWYSEPDMLASHGKLGRSQGCFAVGDSLLAEVFNRLGEGRMIFAAKV